MTPQGLHADFPKDEYTTRWKRAWDLMREAGLSALLVTSQANYRYVTGHVTYAWISRSRPLVALLVQGRAPITVTAELEGEIIRQTSWITDARTYLGFDAECLALLVDVMEEHDLDDQQVGVDYGSEMRLGMPLPVFEELRCRAPRVRFVDGAPLLWRLRKIKSQREIEYIRKACIATSKGLMQALREVRAGITERSVHKRMFVCMLEAGADDVPFLPIHSGPGNYNMFGRGPTERRIRRGDIVWADPAATVRGYYSDFCRMVAVEHATAEQRQAYRVIRDITGQCVEAIRPGIPISDVVKVRDQAFARLGFVEPGTRSGRMGHASGLEMTEPPSVGSHDKTVLEPGMIIHVEPKMIRADGAFVLEEIVAVTANGSECLTPRAPATLPVCG